MATPSNEAIPPLPLWRYAQLFRKAVQAWSDDYASSMGAALAYYTAFSLAPLLIVVLAIAGLVVDAKAAQGEVVDQLSALIGPDGAQVAQALLASASRPATSVVASIVGLVTLLLGATSVFAELQSSLDRIWRAPALQQDQGIWQLVRGRLLSFGMVVSIGFILLVSLVVSAALAAAGQWSHRLFPGWRVTLELLNLVASFGITTLLFAMVYRILPRVWIAWTDVWVGAAVTAAMFAIGKSLIGLYLGRAAIASGFGAAGSLVVLLAWVYYSSQIFLLGAEFTWVFAHNHGSRARAPHPGPSPVVPLRRPGSQPIVSPAARD